MRIHPVETHELPPSRRICAIMHAINAIATSTFDLEKGCPPAIILQPGIEYKMFSSSPTPALAHIKVLDLTTVLAGPFATQILGDLGANVLKVERPEGDLTRRIPPHFVGEDSAYFLSVNRNKKSIVLDLRNAGDHAQFLGLVAAADVVVDNFVPGALDRLHIHVDQMLAQCPKLVWCSISGYGQDGPYHQQPAFDLIVQAQSGGMSITGEPKGRPVRAGVPIGDLAAGLYATIGILAALEKRHKDGKGQRIDISMLDCQIAMLSYQAAYHLISGLVPGGQGSGHESIATYRTFIAKDGVEVAVAAMSEQTWRSLCSALDLDLLCKDECFETVGKRHANRVALWEILESRFLERNSAEWLNTLQQHGVPVAPVNTLDRALTDPQVLHREMIVEMQNNDGQRVRVPGNPIKMSASGSKNTYPPSLDEDRDKLHEWSDGE